MYAAGVRSRTRPKLEIRQLRDSPDGDTVHVPGLTAVRVASLGEVERVLARGAAARCSGETKMNARSSRSHSLVVIKIRARNRPSNIIIKYLVAAQ